MKFLRTVVLVALASTACVKSDTRSCGQTLCPEPLVCVRDNECIRPEVLAACEGKLDSDVCQTPEGAMGICGDGVCIADTCGDGRVSFGEVCDGADLGTFTCETFGFYAPEGLACTSDCGFDLSGCGGICGDKVANGSELCDGSDLKGKTCQSLGYYSAAGLTCSESCFYDTTGCFGKCGDDMTQSVEYCDGEVPQGESCLNFGYGAGQLECSKLCGADLAGCRHLRWRTLETYAQTSFRHVWVGDNEELAAVGDGVSVHRKGSTWEARTYNFDALAVWGVAANDLWAAAKFTSGPAGSVVRYDGVQWNGTGSPSLGLGNVLNDIWGTDNNNIYAVGSSGIILHWNGTSWTKSTVGSDELIRVLGTAANNVYALGSTSLYHFNGSTWSLVNATPAPASAFLDLWVDPMGRFYAARYNESPVRLEGTAWVSLGVPPVGSGAAPSPDSLVATVAAGTVLQYDGRTVFTKSVGGERLTRHGSRVYSGGEGQVYVFDGGTYDSVPDTAVKIVEGAWVSPTGSLFVAGISGEIARFDGASWTTPLNVGGGNKLHSIVAFADNDLWVTGVNTRLRHCSTACTTTTNWVDVTLSGSAFADVPAIWGRNSNDLYVATRTSGSSGISRLSRISSNVATFEYQPAFKVAALHGTSDRVFAVGEGGKIATRQAGSWTEQSTSVTANLNAVCAVANNDIWVFGDAGAVSHYNGTTWTTYTLPTGVNFTSCVAYASDDVLAVSSGELWHWNGQAFSPATPPLETGVTAIAPTPGGVFFASSHYEGALEVTSVVHLFKPATW